MIELYQRVCLAHEIPEYNLKQGDIATLIDTVPHPEGGEKGYVLEIFNVLGDSINIIIVPQSAVIPLQSNQIYSARVLIGV